MTQAVDTIAEPGGAVRRLGPADLLAEQERTLATPRRQYGLAARILFRIMDAVYGHERTLSKFKVLEVVARVPYQAWENVAYVAVTHRYSRPAFARRIFERVQECRRQQDNEQWHLLILEELVDASGQPEAFIRHRLFPQVLAFVYYQLSWILYALRPARSYRLNADLEDHAEHEYAEYVADHPELENEPYDGLFANARILEACAGEAATVDQLVSRSRLPPEAATVAFLRHEPVSLGGLSGGASRPRTLVFV